MAAARHWSPRLPDQPGERIGRLPLVAGNHVGIDGQGHHRRGVAEALQVAFPGNSMYHATKWGIEGFAESVAQEVAPFGIGVTIVEPGGARTEFRYGSAQVADLLPAYDGTPAHSFLACSTPPTGSPPVTLPGWPPPSSPAPTRSQPRCASCSDRKLYRPPSASSRTVLPASRRRPTWPPRQTLRQGNNQEPTKTDLRMPGEERRRCHREDFGPAVTRYEPSQRGEPGPVGRRMVIADRRWPVEARPQPMCAKSTFRARSCPTLRSRSRASLENAHGAHSERHALANQNELSTRYYSLRQMINFSLIRCHIR